MTKCSAIYSLQSRRLLVLVLVILVLALCNVASVSAQEHQPNNSVTSDAASGDPTGFSLPPLPDPSQGQPPMVVSGTAAQPLRSIIPEPLYAMIRSGELPIRVLAHAPWDTAPIGELWSQAPQQNCLHFKGIADGVNWMPGAFPCGPRLTIDNNTASNSSAANVVEKNSTPAQDDRARRFLLNVERSLAGSGVSRTEFDVRATGSTLSSGALRLERMAPALLQTSTSASSKSAVLWRERMTWLEPKPINGTTTLTLRFRGADEDMIFTRSPVTERFRQLTGSNRGDQIFGIAFAAEDVLVWGAKSEWLDFAKVVSVRTALVPIFGTARVALQPAEEGCGEVQLGSATGSSIAAVWSNNLLFVPREVIEIEATSGDPFSIAGKMRVAIDAQTMLPVMKIIYDRVGQQQRVVVGSLLGLTGAASSSLSANVIGPVMTIASGDRAAVLYPELMMVCDRYVPSLNEKSFDLRSVSPEQAKDSEKTKTNSGVATGAHDATASNPSVDSSPEVIDER